MSNSKSLIAACFVALPIFGLSYSNAEQVESPVEGFDYTYISGNSFTKEKVNYEIRNGMAVMEGDIILGTVEEAQLWKSQGAPSQFPPPPSATIIGAHYLWTDGLVPYEIDPSLSSQAKQDFIDAMAHFREKTTIDFIERTPDIQDQYPDYVVVVGSTTCQSSVGRKGDRQEIKLASNCGVGGAIHEIGHAIGLYHEQSRDDRDEHVTINFHNIGYLDKFGVMQDYNADTDANFKKYELVGDRVLDGPYDYASIMHYASHDFSKNGLPTIVPKVSGVTIGQRKGLSDGDVYAINELYKACIDTSVFAPEADLAAWYSFEPSTTGLDDTKVTKSRLEINDLNYKVDIRYGTPVGNSDPEIVYAGKVGNALKFDGIDDAAHASATAKNIVLDGNISIEGWVYLDNADGTQAIATRWYTDRGIWFGLDNGYLKLKLGDQSQNVQEILDGNKLNIGEWYHVAASVNSSNSTANIYINGDIGSTSETTVVPSNLGESQNRPTLGATYSPAYSNLIYTKSDFFAGMMDEMAFFSGALSTQQIRKIYDASSAGKCAATVMEMPEDIVAFYQFDDVYQTNGGSTEYPKNESFFSGISSNYNILYTADQTDTYSSNRHSMVGDGFYFDGYKQYGYLYNHDQIQMGTDDFTIEMWIMTRDPYGTILEKFSGSGDNQSGYGISLLNGSVIFQMASDSKRAWSDTSQQYSVADGKPHHIAVTVNREGLGKIFVDGIRVSLFSPLKGNIDSTDRMYLASDGENDFMKLMMDELSIYKRELSDAEISRIYRALTEGKQRATFTWTFSDSNNPSMHLVGSFNGWNTSNRPMTLIRDNTWQAQIDLDENESLKFVPSDWSLSFGDRNADGIADSNGGGNIITPGKASRYAVTFNEVSQEYYIKDLLVNPTADAGNDQDALKGQHVILKGTASTDADSELFYTWSSEIFPTDLSGQTVNFQFNDVGEYEVVLTVSDARGRTAIDSMIVSVEDASNRAPTANAGPDQTVSTSQSVITLTATATDPDNNIGSIRWYYPGSAIELSARNSLTTTFQNPGVGSYTFYFDAVDDFGLTSTDTVTVNVVEDSLQSTYPTMHLVGNFNGWSTSATPLTLVSNYTWQTEVELTAGSSVKFVPNDWSLSFGDRDKNGVADSSGGGNIIVPSQSGNYLVTFNDRTKAYSLVANIGPQAPKANAGSDKTVKVGSEVTLSGAASTDADNDIVSYSWSNGFGSGQTVSKYMTSIGTFDVTLTVTDAEGNTDTDTVRITVRANQAPTVNAGADQTVRLSQTTINLNGSASDSDGNIGLINWTQTGGTPVTLTTASALQTSFTNPGVGSHSFQLVVKDNDGKTSTDNVTIRVVEEATKSTYPSMHLVGNFNSWSTTATPMTLVGDYTWKLNVTLASGTTVKFVPKDWSISFGDRDQNGVADSNGGGNIQVSNGTGEYEVRFNDQTKRYSLTRIVGPQPPVADAGNNRTILPGIAVGFDGSGSSDAGGSIVSYEWSSSAFPSSLSGVKPSFRFNQEGSYVVTLTVTDNDGQTAQDTITVLVASAPPIATYSRMNIVGSVNSWKIGDDPMSLVSDYTWEMQMSFNAGDQFKFVPYTWSTSYGDNDKNGVADSNGGGNIQVTTSGTYLVRFNDQSKQYSLTKM